MTTTEQALLIILSGALAVFLVLGIITLVNVIKWVKTLRAISDKVLEVADNVESASETLKKAAGPMAFGKMFMNMADTVMKHKKGK